MSHKQKDDKSELDKRLHYLEAALVTVEKNTYHLLNAYDFELDNGKYGEQDLRAAIIDLDRVIKSVQGVLKRVKKGA